MILILIEYISTVDVLKFHGVFLFFFSCRRGDDMHSVNATVTYTLFNISTVSSDLYKKAGIYKK